MRAEKKVIFREARENDVEAIVDLVVRLKRLNEEFDALLKVRSDIRERAKTYITNAIKDKNSLVLIAEYDNKIIGVLKADIRERLFNDPAIEGYIIEFYIMPEYRKQGLGTELLQLAIEKLKQRGAQIIAAEFPSQNKIAVEFYAKQGFRPIVNIHAKQV
ncbi:MAG: GNAT family N-acetyltransferase [Thermoprotei archaeon]|jgi:ribosomal protein S18 acetylase RimI-like enzyme